MQRATRSDGGAPFAKRLKARATPVNPNNSLVPMAPCRRRLHGMRLSEPRYPSRADITSAAYRLRNRRRSRPALGRTARRRVGSKRLTALRSPGPERREDVFDPAFPVKSPFQRNEPRIFFGHRTLRMRRFGLLGICFTFFSHWFRLRQ